MQYTLFRVSHVPQGHLLHFIIFQLLILYTEKPQALLPVVHFIAGKLIKILTL